MDGFGPLQLVLASVALAAGGVVKGTIGIGLPIVTIAILSNLLPIPQVLGIVTLPILATNLWQAVHSGNLLVPLKRFWPMIAGLMICLWIGTRLVVALDPAVLYGLLGLVVVLFTLTSFATPNFTLSPRAQIWCAPIAGSLGGLLGGISTIWGPPMMMYFVMIRLTKEEFIRAVGLVWFAASVPLVAGYIDNGILNADNATTSALACIPAFAGLWTGQWLRQFIDQEIFRNVLLAALFLIGLNLIRRALF